MDTDRLTETERRILRDGERDRERETDRQTREEEEKISNI